MPSYGRAGPLLLSVLAGSCAWMPGRQAPLVSAEEALLTRRVEGLKKLLAHANGGSVLDFDQILVVVHQDVVRDLVRATTPFDKTILDRYRIRVSSATTEFTDGFALVRLVGRAELIDRPVSAEVEVLGGLEVLGLEESGLLRCQVRILAVDALEANVAGLDESVRDLIESLGRDGLNALLSEIDVPVRVEDEIVLPAVRTRRFRVASAVVPVAARVTGVRVFAERLWVGVAAQVGGSGEKGSTP